MSRPVTITNVPSRRGRPFAWAAALVGGASALMSAYWALSGGWLINTLGGQLERLAHHPNTGVVLGLWGVVLLKLTACALPLAATSDRLMGRSLRVVRVLATVQAAILTLYGLVFSVGGWLVESGVITPTGHTDRRAEQWHAFLWNPWFLLWGLLVCAALWLSQRDHGKLRG